MKKHLAALGLLLLACTANAQTTWNTTLNTGSSSTKFGVSNDQPINFYTNNTLRMTLSNTGRFGIGTSTPHADFELVGKALFSGDVISESSFIVKDNFHIDHTPATSSGAPSITSFRSGSGANTGFVPY